MVYTKSMTKTQCHWCEAPATGIKQDATAPVEETDVETIERLPICDACHAHWYDGTEEYPTLLPLA